MAFAYHPRQTVLVQVGKIRQISDISGRHMVVMNSSIASRQELANKLRAAGCAVNLEGIDWHTAGDLQPPSVEVNPEPAPLPIKLATDGQQPMTQRQRPQPQMANLILRRAEVVGIRTATSSCGGIFYESQSQEDARGIIACFRNEPSTSRSVFDADCVRAQIVYRKDQEKEIGDGVSSACWLGHDLDMINFRLGESHCVLLGFLDGGNGLVVPWKRRQRHSDGDTISLESLTFEAVASMEIRLIGENNGLLLAPLVLDVSITNKETHIVVKRQ
jgi:hypothetical protein